ncbi:hypothetical protein [Nocardia cyriacigeorgica]|uniref:hypothetical protein n=1 Tax=Nocardia cyriacigeorgica TaxID=135487 RepID=UPI00245701F3|nr:hypothetical protein [Nocardia cyriacigeorgica]
MALLSGRRADWISASELTRLTHRLRRSDATDVALLTRRRAVVHRMSGWTNRGDIGGYLVASGVSALRRGETAARFELGSAGAIVADGYVLTADFASLTAEFGLVDNADEGDIIVRTVTIPDAFAAGDTPIAAVAADLMDSLDTRERSAGTRVLQQLLDEFR